MPDPWHPLRRLSAARIALGRTGGSLPTREWLDFRLAHARARDAVHSPFDAPALAEELRAVAGEVILVESAAASAAEFLRRPDRGRTLADASRARLAGGGMPCDLAIIVSDGLSSRAVVEQGGSLLAVLIPLLRESGWTLAPLVVATRGRVALQDEIGELLGAKMSLMLLGERPGLGAANSLGAYFTHAPRPGLTDASRNCVSNIRAGGLPPVEAAHKLFSLLTASSRLGLSGVNLKDETPVRSPSIQGTNGAPLPATFREPL